MPTAQLNLLQFLNKKQRVFLEAASHQLTLAAGDCLFEKGGCADKIYLVNKGKVTLYSLTHVLLSLWCYLKSN